MKRRITTKLKFSFFTFMLFSFSVSLAQPPGSGWTKRFEDNFSGGSLNESKWFVRTNTGFRRDRVSVGGGNLKIRNVFTQQSVASGGWIQSKQGFGNGQAVKYGYYEARVKIDGFARGQIWPTWWIWGGNFGGTKETTEFDLMEYSGFSARDNNNSPTSSHHYRRKANLPPQNTSRTHTFGDNSRDQFNWHTWGVLWTPTEVSFYYDGFKYLSSNHPEDAAAETDPLRLIFSSSPHLAVPGGQPDNPIPGNRPVPGAPLPSLLVDFVRVWTGGNTGGGGGSGNVVQMRKRNAMGFGVDGGIGGANGQNVYLWSFSTGNVNQKWEEINRGNGFYSYKKKNTNFCLDGGNGGANGQNVYLWTCNNSNQNQHWLKVNAGSGHYRLQKRNAPGFSIDGNNGGANGQSLYLWASNSNNQNQQWKFSSSSREGVAEEELPVSGDGLKVYPNPVDNGKVVTVEVPSDANNSSISVISIHGEEISRGSTGTSGTVDIDLTSASPGTYIISVQGSQGNHAQKLIVR